MADWPPHVTVADVFAIDRRTTDIDTKLAARLAAIAPVVTTVLREATLGTTPVMLLEKTADFKELHESIVQLLEQNGAAFNTPEFVHDGFLPHSTIQKSGRLHQGEQCIIDSVTLVDMFPEGNWQQRRVLATYGLKAK